ncbi:MAG: hypothetical protein F6K14_14185 [Symploca sp. SIO2C1]|nr:hypothetical protein [Symploca sp. SIO2C1]
MMSYTHRLTTREYSNAIASLIAAFNQQQAANEQALPKPSFNIPNS